MRFVLLTHRSLWWITCNKTISEHFYHINKLVSPSFLLFPSISDTLNLLCSNYFCHYSRSSTLFSKTELSSASLRSGIILTVAFVAKGKFPTSGLYVKWNKDNHSYSNLILSFKILPFNWNWQTIEEITNSVFWPKSYLARRLPFARNVALYLSNHSTLLSWWQ